MSKFQVINNPDYKADNSTLGLSAEVYPVDLIPIVKSIKDFLISRVTRLDDLSVVIGALPQGTVISGHLKAENKTLRFSCISVPTNKYGSPEAMLTHVDEFTEFLKRQIDDRISQLNITVNPVFYVNNDPRSL